MKKPWVLLFSTLGALVQPHPAHPDASRIGEPVPARPVAVAVRPDLSPGEGTDATGECFAAVSPHP